MSKETAVDNDDHASRFAERLLSVANGSEENSDNSFANSRSRRTALYSLHSQ